METPTVIHFRPVNEGTNLFMTTLWDANPWQHAIITSKKERKGVPFSSTNYGTRLSFSVSNNKFAVSEVLFLGGKVKTKTKKTSGRSICVLCICIRTRIPSTCMYTPKITLASWILVPLYVGCAIYLNPKRILSVMLGAFSQQPKRTCNEETTDMH